jgi:hypothetical protein
MNNPYTCRLLRRIDRVIYFLVGKKVYWSNSGHLCQRYLKGHSGEVKSFFPDWFYIWACRVQNKYPLTRKVLSI